MAGDVDDSDVIRRRLALVSDQWQSIWRRVSHRQEVVNMAVTLWQRYWIELAGLQSRLTQISEVVSASCLHDVASLPIQCAQMVRLQVMSCVTIVIMHSCLILKCCNSCLLFVVNISELIAICSLTWHRSDVCVGGSAEFDSFVATVQQPAVSQRECKT